MISQITFAKSGEESVSDPKLKWQAAAMLKFPPLSQVRVTRSLVIPIWFLNLSSLFLSSLVCSHCISNIDFIKPSHLAKFYCLFVYLFIYLFIDSYNVQGREE